MNFLQLCQKAASESGTIAGTPSFSTVAGASGRVGKMVAWVSDAFRDIQNERGDWLFMRQSFSKALTIGQTTYTDTAWSLSVARWTPDTPAYRNITLYDPAKGQSDEGAISHIDYRTWRQRYDRGTHDANRPTTWAVGPANSIVFGAKPDKAYVVRGEYVQKPQILAADADIPIMPDQYHGLIVGEALRLMARSDEAFEVLVEKAQQYERLRYPLVRDQTPQVFSMWP